VDSPAFRNLSRINPRTLHPNRSERLLLRMKRPPELRRPDLPEQ
jgi:hypothetical protein